MSVLVFCECVVACSVLVFCECVVVACIVLLL